MTEEHEHADPGAPLNSEGIPDYADDASPRPRPDVEPQRMPTPGEEPVAVDDYGTTAYESSHLEPLGARLLREEPDVPETPKGGERIVEPDEGMREDVDKDMIGREADYPEGDLSAEEAAVNEEPPS